MTKTLISEYVKTLIEDQPHSALANDQTDRTIKPKTLAPLAVRLQRFIDGLPDEERNTPHPLEFFTARLRGNQGKTAQAGAMGEALRKLGYTRKRCWKSDGTFSALWHAPMKESK